METQDLLMFGAVGVAIWLISKKNDDAPVATIADPSGGSAIGDGVTINGKGGGVTVVADSDAWALLNSDEQDQVRQLCQALGGSQAGSRCSGLPGVLNVGWAAADWQDMAAQALARYPGSVTWNPSNKTMTIHALGVREWIAINARRGGPLQVAPIPLDTRTGIPSAGGAGMNYPGTVQNIAPILIESPQWTGIATAGGAGMNYPETIDYTRGR